MPDETPSFEEIVEDVRELQLYSDADWTNWGKIKEAIDKLENADDQTKELLNDIYSTLSKHRHRMDTIAKLLGLLYLDIPEDYKVAIGKRLLGLLEPREDGRELTWQDYLKSNKWQS